MFVYPAALSNEIQVVTESQTPVWNVSKTYGREYGIEIKAPVPCQSQSVYTSSSDTAGSCSPPLPGSVLAAARFKPCSNAIDLCIGDPKQSTGNSAINSWSESMTRKCAWLHDRYRWSMDAAKLTVPVGIQISHPRITSARRMSFKWRRPDDSVWKSGWELYLVDDEGDSYGAGRSVCRGKFPMGKARVLARWTDNESELTDKGRLQMMDGWGENWELMVAVTLFAVEEKTRKRR